MKIGKYKFNKITNEASVRACVYICAFIGAGKQEFSHSFDLLGSVNIKVMKLKSQTCNRYFSHSFVIYSWTSFPMTCIIAVVIKLISMRWSWAFFVVGLLLMWTGFIPSHFPLDSSLQTLCRFALTLNKENGDVACQQAEAALKPLLCSPGILRWDFSDTAFDHLCVGLVHFCDTSVSAGSWCCVSQFHSHTFLKAQSPSKSVSPA